jgi:hypothetical protein
VSIAGNLRTMPFADLVQWLSNSFKTGTLVIDGPRYTTRIYFRRGSVVAVASDNPREMLGYYLVGWGYLGEDELQYLIEMQDHFKVMLGELVVQMGHLGRPEIDHLIRIKTEETIYDLMLWDEGNFRFLEGELPERDFLELQLPVHHFLLEGHRQRDERVRFSTLIPSSDHVPVLLEAPDASRLNNVEQAILEAIDGTRSIEEIALTVRVPEFNVLGFVFQGLQSGTMRLDGPSDQVRSTPGHSHAPWHEAIYDIEDRVQRERLFDALQMLAGIRDKYPESSDVGAFVEATEARIDDLLHSSQLSDRVILEPTAGLPELMNLDCAPAEGFVLSRINGFYSIQEVLSQLPGSDLQNRAILHNLLRRGLVKVRETRSVRRYRPTTAAEEALDVDTDDDPFQF